MLIRKKYIGKYVGFAMMSLLSAAGSIGFIYMVNRTINLYLTNESGLPITYIVMFFLSISIYLACRWWLAVSIISFTQKLLMETRLEILQSILISPYTHINHSRNRIFTVITQDTNAIVTASVNIVELLTNMIVILLCLGYMFILSPKLLMCLVAVILITAGLYYYRERHTRTLFQQALTHNDRFIKYLNEVLSGFKEINLERRKGFDIANRHINKDIYFSSKLFKSAQLHLLNNRTFGQIAFYIFIVITVVYAGSNLIANQATLVNFIFLVFYVLGPVETVIVMLPVFSHARVSLARIAQLRSEINEDSIQTVTQGIFENFQELELNDFEYAYSFKDQTQQEKFIVGPFNFIVKRGEVVFIHGGNGSGKTTFLNLVSGILPSDKGTIKLNQIYIQKENLGSYRLLFSPVFSDFHLFDECYGIEHLSKVDANRYLEVFEISDKVHFDGVKFSTLDLSSGQRKRLALVSALLERKPIIVLDEFAGDQDPEFKRKFYCVILPFIKSMGFTIIGITHDEKYYYTADRLIKVKNGKLIEEKISLYS